MALHSQDGRANSTPSSDLQKVDPLSPLLKDFAKETEFNESKASTCEQLQSKTLNDRDTRAFASGTYIATLLYFNIANEGEPFETRRPTELTLRDPSGSITVYIYGELGEKLANAPIFNTLVRVTGLAFSNHTWTDWKNNVEPVYLLDEDLCFPTITVVTDVSTTTPEMKTFWEDFEEQAANPITTLQSPEDIASWYIN